MKIKYGLLLFTLPSILSCTSSPTFEQVKNKIKAQNEKLHQVVATKNTDLLKAVYAEDANFLSPGAGIVKGMDSIIAQWKSGLDQMIEMHSRSIEIGGNADLVYEVGVVETKIKSSKRDTDFIYKAKYSNVWRRDGDGEYRLVVDSWNDLDH